MRKTAKVRVIELNGVLVLANSEQKIDSVKKWFEKSESTKVEDWRIYALTDVRDGLPISEQVENAEFDLEDLPKIL